MNVSLVFLRVLVLILSIVFMTIYFHSLPEGKALSNTILGVSVGLLFGLLLIGFDIVFRRFNLRSFNIAIIGIFIGYLMGQGLILVFDALIDISSISVILQPQTLEIIKMALLLFGVYLGMIMTLRSSDELYVS